MTAAAERELAASVPALRDRVAGAGRRPAARLADLFGTATSTAGCCSPRSWPGRAG